MRRAAQGDEGVVRDGAGHGRQRRAATTLDPRVLDAIVRRIVEAAQPEKIILFGSAARGEMTSSSDLDLLVVKDHCHRRKTAALIYRNLPKPRPPVDVVVAWPEDLRRHKDSFWLVIAPALREGRTIYESAPGA